MQLSFPGRQEPQKGTALPVSGSVINQHGIGSNSIDRNKCLTSYFLRRKLTWN